MAYVHSPVIEFGFKENLPYEQQYTWVKGHFGQMLHMIDTGVGFSCPEKYLIYLKDQKLINGYQLLNGKLYGTIETGLFVQHQLPWIRLPRI